MARFATPGVYIKERNAFSSSVVAVPTAVPVFIGYTEKAARGKNSLVNQPTRVTSLSEYMAMFGGAPQTTFSIKEKGDDYELSVDQKTHYRMFNGMRMFYANGGGTCYIVSVGDYSGGVEATPMMDALTTLLAEQEPTIVVAPDATLLDQADCYSLYQAMLKHCGSDTKSRFAIFDVYNGDQERTFDKADVVTAFREGVGNNHLGWGAGYYPWVNTTTVSSAEVTFKNVSNPDTLASILTKEAERTYLGGAAPAPTPAPAAPKGDDKTKKATPAPKKAAASQVDPKMQAKFDAVKAEIDRLKDPAANPKVVHQNLKAISPTYKSVLGAIRETMNLMPPSAAMAGIYSMVDNNVGVFKSPANVSINGVVAPSLNITSENQEDLNVPINGKAVNAIRGFVGKGVLVWGARTLDGNSQDWRYISVRRTVTYIEQSIKNAMEAYVFEANTSQTWIKVKTSIDNFLTSVWRTGALVGASPNEAFDTAIGMGETMTPTDVLDGIMRITVRVAITRPAEFIEITFEQKMQEGPSEVEEGGDEGGGEE